jgi:hypothetical protein
MSKESIEFRILKMRGPVSHEYTAAGKTVVLYIFICIFFWKQAGSQKILDRHAAGFPLVKS